MPHFPVTIDADAATPPFEQIRQQVIDGVRDGSLAAGHKLPTVRALAEQLGLAVNTVAKAYRSLEAEGVIETRGRSGSFVSAHGDVTQRKAQLAAKEYADRMRELRVDADDALTFVKGALGIRR